MSRYGEIISDTRRVLLVGVIVSICLQCGRRYREVADPNGRGGESHGLCGNECEDEYRAAQGFPPRKAER